ncbi:MAG: hypothetical protein JNK64_32875 [Myxococcales bacterium]|nr:hypothetical protein [Myxococcales bacterium]
MSLALGRPVTAALLAGLCVACGAGAAAPALPPAAPSREAAAPTAAVDPVDPSIPPAAAAAVADAMTLGGRLFDQDRASAAATDAALAGGMPPTAQGWITRRTAHGWRVDFYGPVDGQPASLVTVPVDDAGVAGAPVRHTPPATLDEEGRAMVGARVAAIAAFTPICGGPYNVDVVPGGLVGAPGWLVYFSPGTTDPDAAVLAGYVRIAVAVGAAGPVVTDVAPLSKTCVIVGGPAAPPPSAKVAALVVTHFVTPTATEAHVFASLRYRQPVMVMVDGGVFTVDDGRVTWGAAAAAP